MRTLRFAICVVLAGITWVATSGGAARACSCAEVDDNVALAQATEVFVARIDAVDDSAEHSDTFRVRYLVEVDAVFKGEVFATQVVTTSQRGGGCGAEMALNSTHLVFARRQGGVELFTSLCSGNRPATAAMAGEAFGPASQPIDAIDSSTAGFGLDLDVASEKRSLNASNVVFVGGLLLAIVGVVAVAGVVLGGRVRRGTSPTATMEE